MKRFVSEALLAPALTFDAAAAARGEPSLPPSFAWRERTLVVDAVVETRRSTKLDRGEAYLDKHWFVFRTPEGEIATVYFARRARRGEPRWWLYTLEDRG